MANTVAAPKIGGKIRRLRRQRAMNQSDLAAALGISPSYLNLIEHNRRNVTVPLLLKLAGYFGLEITDLSESDEASIANDLMECFGDDLLCRYRYHQHMDVRDVASSNPAVAKAMLHLYDVLQKLKKNGATGVVNQDDEEAGASGGLPVSPFLIFCKPIPIISHRLKCDWRPGSRSDCGLGDDERLAGLTTFLAECL